MARNIRNMSQKKCGPHKVNIGFYYYSQKSFIYIAKGLYNKLPRNITLSKNYEVFKKWLKIYTFDKSRKLPEREDIEEEYIISNISNDNIRACEYM